MKVSFLSTGMVNNRFGSKVVYENPTGKLTQSQKDFIDKFEEADTFSRVNSMNCSFLGEGVSAKAYYSLLYGFVIKETKKDSPIAKKGRYDKGSLYQENSILQKLNDKIVHSQRGIAYVETEKNGEFLLSTLVSGKRASYSENPYNKNNMNMLLRTLYRLDKNGILNTDLTGSNVLVAPDNINIIDYQWGEEYNPAAYNNLKFVSFPQFEVPSNITLFEGAALAGYISSVPDIQEFMADYLKQKLHYTEKKIRKLEELYEQTNSSYLPERIRFEKAKAHVYQNPTSDVINMELLKMRILKNHRKQYSCIDTQVCKPRNVLDCIKHSVNGYLVSNAMATYPLDSSKYDSQSLEYFNFMKRYGEFGKSRVINDYIPTLKWIARMLTNEEYIPANIIYPSEISPIETDIDAFNGLKFQKNENNSKFQSVKNSLNLKAKNLSRKMYNIYKNDGYATTVYDDIDSLFGI